MDASKDIGTPEPLALSQRSQSHVVFAGAERAIDALYGHLLEVLLNNDSGEQLKNTVEKLERFERVYLNGLKSVTDKVKAR